MSGSPIISRGKSSKPALLEDAGTCIVCGEPRVIHMQRGVPIEAYLDDPFCSSVCAREHFGVEFPQPPRPKKGYTQ